MSELSGREVELLSGARSIAAADNRDELLQKQQEAAIRRENQEHLQGLRDLYGESGLATQTDSLCSVLGTVLTLDSYHAISRSGSWSRSRVLERPLFLGARKASIDWAANHTSSASVQAMHGEIVFYRTLARKEHSYDTGDKYDSERIFAAPQYDERGFFTVLLQPRPTQYESAAPLLCYGDLDAITWRNPVHKLLIPILFGRDPELTSSAQPKLDDKEAFLQALTADYEDRVGVLRRKRVFRGILRSNQQVWMPQDEELTMTAIREAMQLFIDTWYNPLQTNPEHAQEVKEAIPAAQREFLRDPQAVATFDVVQAITRTVEDGHGKQRQLDLVVPQVSFGWEWDDCLKRVTEYPLYRRLKAELKRELDEENTRRFKEGLTNETAMYNYLMNVMGQEDQQEEVLKRMKAMFTVWNSDPQQRAQDLYKAFHQSE